MPLNLRGWRQDATETESNGPNLWGEMHQWGESGCPPQHLCHQSRRKKKKKTVSVSYRFTWAHRSSFLHFSTSRTNASFLPCDRSSSDTSSELSECERKSRDLCLGSGIGEPTPSSVSSCKQNRQEVIDRRTTTCRSHRFWLCTN